MISYFSTPSDHLDPALFNDMELREEVRMPLISAACETLIKAGLKKPGEWLSIWLTGSGITYQWQDNHDLDVQMGISYDTFLKDNPDYKWVDQFSMENRINSYLRTFIWPKMEHATFNGKEFTVTYFWNSAVESDITAIHPYAAYNITDNRWVTKPPEIPADPKSLYPKAWFDTAKTDEEAAKRLYVLYAEGAQIIRNHLPGTPEHVTASSKLNLVASQAQSLYDDIHEGRKEAFTSSGKGYYDWHNFRWQQSKESGTKELLKTIIDAHSRRKEEAEIALYGTPISSAQEALEESMNFRFGKRYDR